MSSLLAKVAPLKPEIRLAQAISLFEADLSTEQKAAFQSNKHQSRDTPPDIRDVMRLTAEIDRLVAGKVGIGRCFGTRLVNVLQAVQQFAALGDILVGGSQNMIACGVWSMVRLTLLMFVNTSSYFDKLSALLMIVGRSAPRYEAMALLYPQSKKLQSYLSEYFLVIVRLCHDLLKSTRKSMFGQLTSFMSDSDIRSCQSDFDLWATAIKDEVNLLTACERKEQTHILKALSKSSSSDSNRKKLENHLRVLESCSTYDYQKTWKEIRRCGNTVLFTQTPQYQDWKTGIESCTLLYAGSLGSGKSILLTNMVDDLNLHDQNGSLMPVAYFFCRHDDQESLKSRTILGSLARQLLCTLRKPATMLEDFTTVGPPVLNSTGILRLLRWNIPSAYKAYIVLDGLDECDESEKEEVIRCLRELQDMFAALVCLSLRREAGYAPRLNSEQLVNQSLASIPEDNPDIAEFICAELERRVVSGKLCLGEPTLILQIRDALLEGAQGMFLWVVLQIDAFCAAKTDKSIRQALADLPRDLPGIFSRILQQAEAFGNHYQKLILQLVTVACRPLTTDELREALGVVPGDADWNPPNDIYSALACCGSLIIVDEETLSVKLVHHSVKQFLLCEPEGVIKQGFTTKGANKAMTDILITYLDYNIFETQLSTIVVPQLRPEAIPSKIIRSSLDSSHLVQKVALRLLKSRVQLSSNISKILAEESNPFDIQPASQFYFLHYARSYWLQHILRHAKHEFESYGVLGRVLHRNVVDINMRDEYGWTPLCYAIQEEHEAVVRLLLEAGAAIESEDNATQPLIVIAALKDNEVIVQLLLERGADIESEDQLGNSLLSIAAEKGHEGIVRLLLEKGAHIDVKDCYGYTPLFFAAQAGQESIVQLLLEKGAAIEVGGDRGRTLVSIAAQAGQESIVQLLLEKGASIEVKHYYGQTPLFFAVQAGHEGIIRLLLKKGAAIEGEGDGGRTLLSIATEVGQEGIIRLLIENGATIDLKDRSGQMPLFLAAKAGQEGIVRLLLEKGAAIEVEDNKGRTPLSIATEAGQEGIIRLLIENGATIDSKDRSGQTPLFLAAKAGQEGIVRLLIENGATINSKDRSGQTPLFLAGLGGHEAVVQLLKSHGV